MMTQGDALARPRRYGSGGRSEARDVSEYHDRSIDCTDEEIRIRAPGTHLWGRAMRI